ncbi:hypothetical protein BDW02DRAFT_581193 [Decorospora gaudefroyi]|uniref:Uncharacterized protein n=1 Tax=Decorospora gaudefroyi TaxID=184978 RepID=A0A6A5KGL7_9PLEO|nr:hypothetical protein BDW02DRAFT_41808 [Decorospora gaudefroyi]KAF1832523.1 hypothetical protein BDW02DRAFT_581193 [Decorospora gaudefroyi]
MQHRPVFPATERRSQPSSRPPIPSVRPKRLPPNRVPPAPLNREAPLFSLFPQPLSIQIRDVGGQRNPKVTPAATHGPPVPPKDAAPRVPAKALARLEPKVMLDNCIESCLGQYAKDRSGRTRNRTTERRTDAPTKTTPVRASQRNIARRRDANASRSFTKDARRNGITNPADTQRNQSEKKYPKSTNNSAILAHQHIKIPTSKYTLNKITQTHPSHSPTKPYTTPRPAPAPKLKPTPHPHPKHLRDLTEIKREILAKQHILAKQRTHPTTTFPITKPDRKENNSRDTFVKAVRRIGASILDCGGLCEGGEGTGENK